MFISTKANLPGILCLHNKENTFRQLNKLWKQMLEAIIEKQNTVAIKDFKIIAYLSKEVV